MKIYSNVGGMNDDLDKWIRDCKRESKDAIKREAAKFAEKVKHETLPYGPPKKKKGDIDYFPGKLRESTTLSFTDLDDVFTATVSVGKGINYAQFALAKKRGENPWRGDEITIAKIDEALRGKSKTVDEEE